LSLQKKLLAKRNSTWRINHANHYNFYVYCRLFKLQTAQLKSRLNAAAIFYFNPNVAVENPLMPPIAKA